MGKVLGTFAKDEIQLQNVFFPGLPTLMCL